MKDYTKKRESLSAALSEINKEMKNLNQKKASLKKELTTATTNSDLLRKTITDILAAEKALNIKKEEIKDKLNKINQKLSKITSIKRDLKEI